MTLFLSHSFSFHHIHFVTQTLTTLDLRHDQIGDNGAQHLADAFRNNRVSLFLSYFSSFHHIHFFTQALTTLDLGNNRIGDEGAQHLADALRNNTMTVFLSHSSSFHHIHFSHRHSPHYISYAIKSDPWEHNIWPMHYEITG